MQRQNLFCLSMSSNTLLAKRRVFHGEGHQHTCRRISLLNLQFWQHTSSKYHLEFICKSFSVNDDCKTDRIQTDLQILVSGWSDRECTVCLWKKKIIWGLKSITEMPITSNIFWIITLSNLFWEIFILSAFY